MTLVLFLALLLIVTVTDTLYTGLFRQMTSGDLLPFCYTEGPHPRSKSICAGYCSREASCVGIGYGGANPDSKKHCLLLESSDGGGCSVSQLTRFEEGFAYYLAFHKNVGMSKWWAPGLKAYFVECGYSNWYSKRN